MADARIHELKNLLPRCLLPDWVRVGSRLVRLLRDHHHPSVHEAILNRLLAQAKASVALRQKRQAQVPTVSYPPELPITSRAGEIVDALRQHQALVIAGETGSGKTTQIPKMCLQAGLGIEAKIGCTQPRRVAALSISRRVAEELNVYWGREVGCKIRFDDRSSPETYIKFMTDGILLAETQGDPLLTEYNALIIDEAHERSLNIDFLLGYLKGLLAKRTDLKLIITSATIDTESFSRAFNAPIIEVSGRVYPVEVQYAPFDPFSEEEGETTYIDAAVNATERALCEPGSSGDVLIFMPGERDIRETTDQLQNRFGRETEIIPLFGRLSSGDQQRVFAPCGKRKIVVATNIAETSLTIPNIRFVIDSGLARISRYNSRTRTKRLPVEPISQSSANQRKGRSGRVRQGVCIRLYSEEDFTERPQYTQPEIQRANLAEVILRMKAWRLGEIETFPFLNPPTPAAIASGYILLQELGALDEAREVTPLGRDLSRLPIDPTLGRMLLQSQQEHATRELLIIAAGLSIQDPRERPFEQKDAASAAHQKFVDPTSDFLTLLNIWNAYHDQWESLRTQNQRRKFCKAHFLSYLRMREWQDLHAQLHEALEDLGTLRLNESTADYAAIHRSILTGLLGHVACRQERNQYKTFGNRQAMVFPGSALFDRGGKPAKAGTHAAPAKPTKSSQPAWLVAGEIVETSQLFARTVAGIDPTWILQLAPHLCKTTHSNPRWEATAGRVLVQETVTLYGMEILRRNIGYATVNPSEATAIFIRSALVEGPLLPPSITSRRDPKHSHDWLASAATDTEQPALPSIYNFLEHNRQVRNKLEIWRTRTHSHDLPDLDQALCDFYSKRLENVSSTQELNRILRDKGGSTFLCASETDLLGDKPGAYNPAAFPDSVPLGGQLANLSYSYAPGEDHDGVTVKLGLNVARTISPASIEWAVPGLREEQVNALLKALPKSLRRPLMPLPPKAAEIARELRPGNSTLLEDLARFIHQRYGIEVSPHSWPPDALPPHLRPRIQILGKDQSSLAVGRELDALRKQLEKSDAPAASHEWQKTAQKWERFGISKWNFGDLPDTISITHKNGSVLAWPRLHVEDGNVSLRLFNQSQAAQTSHLLGIHRLIEIALQKDLGWLQKDLRSLSRFEPMLTGLCTPEELQAGAFANARRYLLPAQPFLTASEFEAAVAHARERLAGLASQLADRIQTILEMRWQIYQCLPALSKSPAPNRLSDFKQLGNTQARPQSRTYSTMAHDLNALIPKNFLEAVPFERLPHIPRYLKAMLIRAERASLNPVKDQERAKQITHYQDLIKNLKAPPAQLRELRWMLEEFKVSVFAQELGTPSPISPKRLDEKIAQLCPNPSKPH